MSRSVFPLLLAARRRLLLQATARYIAVAWVGAATAVLLWALWGILKPGAMAWSGWVAWVAVGAAGLFGIGTLGAIVLALRKQPSLGEVAERLDRKADTHDRLTTALALERRSTGEGAGAQSLEPMEQAALDECRTWFAQGEGGAGFQPERWLPWRVPRELPWAGLPLVALIALMALRGFYFSGDPSGVSGSGEIDPKALVTAERLEEMAKALGEKPDAEALKKVADALKQSAEKLRSEAQAGDPETAQKAVLRELSAAEEAMKSARQQGAMNALADAMEPMKAQPHAAEAIEAMRKGSAGEAARQVDQLAESLAAAQSGKGAGSREERMEQLAKAMQEAMQKLGEASRIGQAAAEAREAAQRGDTPGASQAMRQMAQALRESRESGQSGERASGQPQEQGGKEGQSAQSSEGATSEEIRKMLSALEQMKRQSGGESQSASGEGEGEKGMAMQPGQGNAPPGQGEGMQGQGEMPGGQPGSELDFGTKASALGSEAAPPPTPPDLQTQLQGLLGEGQSLHTLLPSRSGEAPARTGYRELYEAAAPAAEDAMERENIPLGARLTIKRYFESIRPSR